MELTKLFFVLLFVASTPVEMAVARTHNQHRKHPPHNIALPPISEPPAPAPQPPAGSGSGGRHLPAPVPSPRPPAGGVSGGRHLPAPQPPEGGSSDGRHLPSPLPAPINPAPPPAASSDRGSGGGDPSNSTAIFDVRAFGAVGDGVSDDTEAFKSAWDSACEGAPGVVLVPQGYSFMIRSTIFAGPCHGALVLQVEGTITAPDGPDAWPQNNSRRQWLVFYRADGLSLQGGGLIDGKGEKWWNLPCKPHKGVNGSTLPGPCDSPVALRFFMSSNLTVHSIRLQNSPQFHFRFDNCKSVTIDTISINSPPLSPNTDGIHVENTQNVGIYNSVISNGDDCVSIGAGSTNIDIRNITCGPGHGISIGSLGKLNSRACVTNVTVRNCVIKHSDNGLRIKTWQGGSGAVSSVSYDNIRMDTVRNPIIIDQYYCLTKVCKNQTSAVYVSDVSYRGIKGTYDIRSPPMHFGCSDSVPCTNVTLTDVELLPANGDFVANAFCWNVYGAMQTLTIPPVSCLLEGLPRSIMDIDSDRCF